MQVHSSLHFFLFLETSPPPLLAILASPSARYLSPLRAFPAKLSRYLARCYNGASQKTTGERNEGSGVNRIEALNILGLDDDATAQDIKTAYKECVQIFHPDRFAGNKKLQERATEQFKRLQDAYEFLKSGRGSKEASGSARSSRSVSYVEAQLAGLAAARTQLVAQRDALYDERRNAVIMMAVGAAGAILGRRVIWIAGIAGALIVWGIVSVIAVCQNISAINDHLKEIDMQKRQLEQDWEED